MRTKEFTFKKTKRIRVEEHHDAISVDLTVKEAADLIAYLRQAVTPDYRFLNLLEALTAFVEPRGIVSDLKPDTYTSEAFRMVKR